MTGSAVQPRRAVVVIPGIQRRQRFERRDALVRNLEAVVERHPVIRGEEVEVAGESGLGLVPRLRETDTAERQPELDVFEAYWVDMLPEQQTSMGPWGRLAQGLDLLLYWPLNWRSWRAMRLSPYMTVALVVGAVLLVTWYLSLTLLVSETLLQGDGGLPPEIAGLPLVGTLLGWYFEAAKAVSDWRYWAVVALVLSVVRVASLVELAQATKAYLENQPDPQDIGLRDRIRARVASTLEHVLEQERYGEVLVVAHSFGTVIAVDILADWPRRQDFRRLGLVTLGSPIAMLRLRSNWLGGQLQRLLNRDECRCWLDFHSGTDWFCSPVPGHRQRFGHAASHALDFEASLRQRFSGFSHLLYYRAQPVLETLTGPMEGASGSAPAPLRESAD